jgi:hypothetical protein
MDAPSPVPKSSLRELHVASTYEPGPAAAGDG